MTTFRIIPNTTQRATIKTVITAGQPGPTLSPSAVRWSPSFQATGLTFTGSGSTYPTYNSYYTHLHPIPSTNLRYNKLKRDGVELANRIRWSSHTS